ncbi:trypsin-like peptidase domain-containing protein [Chloroflexota bacterium]
MTHKAIIVILILLTVLSGGLGYHSYTLSQQLDLLNENLTVFQEEQATRVAAVSTELTALRVETLTRIDDLKKAIDKNLNSMEAEIGDTQTSVATLEDEIDKTIAEVDILEDELGKTTGELAQSVIDASEVYQKVSQATVRISNGSTIIGSGFIFDNHAHVVTASHVVENLDTIYITLPDGRISKATNTGNCQFSDIAVLTLESELDVDPLPLADSSKVKIGEPVAAIGNPMELPETLTTGIVSQINRSAEIKYDTQTRGIPNLIQFDAAANFGNSGGPLFNAKGEVIGLVIARVNPTEGDGIYYAVSSNKVKKIVDSIIIHGSYDYPRLGVTVSNITPQAAQARDMTTVNGALVKEVADDSPAGTAGIKVDDIIVAIDGVAISDISSLTSYLGEYKSPGETATITLIRGTSEVEMSLEIGKR